MKIGTWFNVEIEQVEDIGDLEEKLKEVKKEDLMVDPREAVLTGIADLSIDYKTDTIKIKTLPALFPLNKKLNDMFNNKYIHPLLSTVTHAYVNQDFETKDHPRYVLIQKRSKKGTAQGHSEIQPAAAGFVRFGEDPYMNSFREMREETGIMNSTPLFIEKKDKELIAHLDKPKCLDLTIHDLAYKGIKNPLLSYVLMFCPDSIEFEEQKSDRKIRVIKTLAELDSKYDAGKEEVAEVVRVPYENFKDFCTEVWKSGRAFGSTFQSTLSFIDIFEK